MNKTRKILVFSIFIFAVFISTFFYFVLAKEDKLTSESKRLVGKTVNIGDFEKNTFQKNLAIDPARKIWLVYLLSTCEACEKELDAADKLRNDGEIEVIGLMSEDEETVKKFVAEHNINIPILLDKRANFLKTMQLKYFPANFIIENGTIKKALFGLPDDDESLANFVKN